MARLMLASTLVGVCSQRLVAGREGGRVLNTEIAVNTSRVRDLIAGESSLKALTDALAEGDFYGMHTFDQDLIEHVREDRIAREVALAAASHPHDLRLMLDAEGVGAFPGPARARAVPRRRPYAASRALGTKRSRAGSSGTTRRLRYSAPPATARPRAGSHPKPYSSRMRSGSSPTVMKFASSSSGRTLSGTGGRMTICTASSRASGPIASSSPATMSST